MDGHSTAKCNKPINFKMVVLLSFYAPGCGWYGWMIRLVEHNIKTLLRDCEIRLVVYFSLLITSIVNCEVRQ